MKNFAESVNIRFKVITAAITFAVVSVFFACNQRTDSIDLAFSPDSSYTMRATGVSTLISDSGITRYRMIADEWLVFSKATEPYWYFPNGFYVEQFDTLFHPEGSVKADTAYYYTQKEEWVLIGNVKIANLQGEKFDSEKIIWNQKNERIHSDEFIRIEQKDKIITGYGFESDQRMTRYKIFNPKGTFPIPEESDEATEGADQLSGTEEPEQQQAQEYGAEPTAEETAVP